MYIIRKQFKFEMAHQLFNSYSADCHENLHGHSYVMELYLKADKLDDTGMVVDFGAVKELIKDYISEWDHSLTMPKMFPTEYLNMLKKFTKKFRITNYNPTAENMAKDMFNTISNILIYYQKNNYKSIIYTVDKVRLHETTTGWAEYSI